MMLVCPVCRAENEMATACRRCKADLRMLAALKNEWNYRCAAARESIQAGDLAEATELAQSAHRLHACETTARLQAVLALLDGDFSKAWEWYHRAQR